jgi:2-polyprenyl-6-hydroxyphenyl methylase/3-demethylubiquinone-9 3-methyltransferase
MSTVEPRPERQADSFAFGRNWRRYVANYLDPERVDIARQSLLDLVGTELSGKVFLDVGAGSGLFSLCAFLSGAAKVVSFDVDPDSVEACLTLRRSIGDPENWEIRQGSILDREFVSALPPGDVVYSWGVLHHTGDMYGALRNAASLVAPGGLLCIALYNRVAGRLVTSERWLRIKRLYNRSPRFVQHTMEGLFLTHWTARQLYRRRNPRRAASEYKRQRGMALRTDVVDWLGGYPYEFANVDEVVSFGRRECRLQVVRVIPAPVTSIENNQFVFRLAAAD